MTETIGAEAGASARGNLRPQKAGGGQVNAAFASFVAGGLTPSMRDTLRRRQPDLFGEGAVVTGPGMTLKALRRRGVVEGVAPRARVTELGELVIGAAGLPAGDS